MPKSKMKIDEIHINVMVPRDLDAKSIVRTLRSKRFFLALETAAHGTIARFPALAKVSVAVTR